MCFNKKVVGSLALVGLGIFVFAPGLIGAALPLLLVAACPLSMIFMMRGMSGGKDASCSTGRAADMASTDRELAELRAEVERLRAERVQGPLPVRSDSTLN